ncbi:MAG: non-ribosomal peptide synthetase, partial [Acidobacteria bacterium]|nr:non-ribosomal peptide synthetase [Acidobacteriota bacterium]
MSAETTSQKTSVSRRIDGLSPEKRLLLDKLLRAQGVDVARLTKIPRRGEAGPLPLSFAQQRLWFLDQLEPGSPFYNITAALFLHGALNVEALGRSIEEITRRHESLRTVFETSEGKPSQVILPTGPCVFSVEDLSHVAPELREAEARRLIGEESLRPFDLARGPLLRATLYRLGQEKHALLLAVHHIVSDAVSMATLVREVAALYEAFAAGRPSPLAPLPIQYGDYAVWQRDWLAKGEIEGQLAYWREQLAGAPAALELPTDRPRPAVQTFDGAAHHFRLPKGLTDALVALGRREGATLFMTLLAAFDALLYRYTSQEDFSVGTPVAGRTRAETEALIGFFVNTLVLRSRLHPEMSFRELLAEVRRTA